MTVVSNLDKLEIYHESLELAREIYKLTKSPLLSKEFSLVDQIKRASLSVSANIAEGYGRYTKKDFSQFLAISLGSVNEVIAFLDFIKLEFNIYTSGIRERYIILSCRIHSFRKHLLRPVILRT